MKTPVTNGPTLPDAIEISTLERPIDAEVRPPGSKSITNRALACAAMADGKSVLRGALDSEDTQVMADCLRSLGVSIQVRDDGTLLEVLGCGGRLVPSEAPLFVRNSGTSMRFLTALCAAARGRFRLDGVPRMRQRPIGDLAEALRALGTEVVCEGDGACPPVALVAHGLSGGKTCVAGDLSSQFLSGLLLAAPYANRPLSVEVTGELVSVPYVEMTLSVMRAFGGKATSSSDYRKIEIDTTHYQGRDYCIEPDATAASYFFAAAAVTGGKVAVLGLTRESLQGDVAFCDALAAMGCHVEWARDRIIVHGAPLKGIDIDMNAFSDTVQTLAVVALFAEGPTRIRHVGHIRHKETDRIAAVACELRKLGAEVDEYTDGLAITPGQLRGARIETYDDHRMAMSFAIAGLRIRGVTILDPNCTRKTYPHFFDDLSKISSPAILAGNPPQR